MPQIYCNNHAYAAHAICSGGAECHSHANAPSRLKHRALAMYRGGCRCHADWQRRPQTNRNGDIKQSPRPRGSKADLASAAAWALRSSAGHICFMDWCRETPDSPATAAMARTCQWVSIANGPIQVGFSLPHESHCDSKARENPT